MKQITDRLSRRRVLQGSGLALAALALGGPTGFATARRTNEKENVMAQNTGTAKPTIVLVHGAFADSSGWSDITSMLFALGYPVLAVSNPLRGVKTDTDYIARTLKTIKGPLVLVGHSYGGMVINGAASSNPNVKALVFIAGFAPDAGESAGDLSGKFPGSTLGPTLAPPVPLGDGTNDLYIQPDKYPVQFCADLPESVAAFMAATQRPATDLALNEKASGAAWKTIPSWFVWGDLDKNIPAASHRFMAERAKARESLEVKGASHVVFISHANTVANLILKAAESAK
jgi:pimeloyl-ACP methyl ester carboxylesterase